MGSPGQGGTLGVATGLSAARITGISGNVAGSTCTRTVGGTLEFDLKPGLLRPLS